MIGAIIAMDCEAEILKNLMQITATETVSGKKIYRGNLNGKEILLVVCGIGKVNAAIGTQIALSLYKADKIINFGVAGGIKENTEITEIYAIEAAVQYDFDLAELNQTKIGTLDEFKENYLPLSLSSLPLPVRKLATGDRFNDNPADYLLIKDYMQADIRDMEGAAVVQCAIHAGVPVYELKAISDKAGNVSSFEQYNRNRGIALQKLQSYLPEFISEL